jgi:ribosomal protein L31E
MASRMLLTINLRRYLVGQPRNKRKYKAIRYIRERISHYTKTDIDNVLLSQELNSLVLRRLAKSMAPVKLTVKIDNGKATAEPFAPEKERVAPAEKGKETGKRDAPKKEQEKTKPEIKGAAEPKKEAAPKK